MNENITLQELAILQQRNLGNRGFLGDTAGTDGVPGAPAIPYENQKPWIGEPDGSIPIISKQASPLGIVGVTLTLVLLALPEGFDAVINQISNNITGGGFQDGSGDIIWTFLIDGRPIQGLETLNTQNGTTNTPIRISPIRVAGGQTLTGTANHVANGALAGNVVMGVLGYKYPRLATQ